MQESTTQKESGKSFSQEAPMGNFNTDFDFGLFLYILRKNYLWILLIFAFVALSGFLYLRYTAPTYKASAEVQIEKNNKANRLLDVKDYYESNDISAEIEVLKSPMLVEAAIENLPLEVSYYAKGQFLKDEKYKSAPYKVEIIEKDSALKSTDLDIYFESKNKGELRWGPDRTETIQFTESQTLVLPFAKLQIHVTDYSRIKKEQEAVKGVEHMFILNNQKTLTKNFLKQLEILILNINAKTLQINFKDNNRLKAYEFVNSLIHEYRQYTVRKKKQSSIQILSFLNSQIDLVYDKQKSYERQIQVFKRKNNITDIEHYTSIYAERINKMDEAQLELELQISTLKEIKSQIQQGGTEIDIYEFLPMLIGSSYEDNLGQLIENLNQLLLKKQEKLYELKASSTPIKEIDYQIKIQKRLITESINSLLDKYQKRLNNLNKQYQATEERYMNQPETETELLRLKRLYDINERFYTMLVQKKTEYSISQQGFVSDLNILKSATTPTDPIAPNKNIILIIFILGSLFLGFSFIIIKYLFHNKITSISEIKRFAQSNLKILGVVPKYQNEVPNSQLIVNKSPKSMIAESFRSIRSNLAFLSSQKGSKVLAITSTISGEGKTFIAINLGGIIAYSGKKVIIIDLDMRKPKIHKGFNVENKKGMSTILIGRDKTEDCIHHSQEENLDFITAGLIPPNPSELILSENLNHLIEKLKKEYDLVIIDNPPVGIVTDSIEVIRKADYPIYVFRAEFSKKNFVRSLDALINDRNINKLSIILNGVDYRQKNYGDFGAYGYGYNSEYYQDDQEQKKTIIDRLRKK